MHLAPLIQDLAIILGLAGLSALLFRQLRQPVVLGYLVAGIVAGPYTPPFSFVIDIPSVNVWAELGVIFLMFSLGLEFSAGKLLKLGRVPVVTGLVEPLLMLALGYGAGQLMNWSPANSFFLGAILSVSSTTIIVKALDEVGLKRTNFGSVIIGTLVVEDLVGILILAAIPILAGGAAPSWAVLLPPLGKLILLLAALFLLGWLIRSAVDYVAVSSTNETLVLVSLALCLGLVVVTSYMGYSAALGSFLMGVVLAESKAIYRVENLIKPLTDVFSAIFFVSIGMLLNPADIAAHWQVVLAVTALTIFGKIVATSAGGLCAGLDVKTSLSTGLSLAQIGEFSFIIASLGAATGKMEPSLYAVTVAVSVITSFTTPYLIRVARRVVPLSN